jgi:hypothetical protein
MNDVTPSGGPLRGSESGPTTRTRTLYAAGALSALVVGLGASGTLSSWTEAIVTNDSNTADAADAVALKESDGTDACSTFTDADNVATCSSINKYGGADLTPGDSRDVDVTFTNPGGAAGVTFSYAFDSCSSTPGPGAVDLCSDGDLTVAVSCSTGTTYSSAARIADLGQSASAPSGLAGKSWTPSPGPALAGLEASAVTCRFTTALASDAPAASGGSQVSQPITWTLSAV